MLVDLSASPQETFEGGVRTPSELTGVFGTCLPACVQAAGEVGLAAAVAVAVTAAAVVVDRLLIITRRVQSAASSGVRAVHMAPAAELLRACGGGGAKVSLLLSALLLCMYSLGYMRDVKRSAHHRV